jgi:hypothetical protein
MTDPAGASPRPTRRAFLGTSGLLLATGLAGCTGRSLASFAASPATVPAATLDRTGYEERSVDEEVIRQGFGGVEAVEVRNWVAQYERPLAPSVLDALPGTADAGDQRLAVFAVLSTPKVEVGGREFNPVAGFSANDVLDLVQSTYGGLREVERADDRAVTVLGTATRVVEYRAAGGLEAGGTSADVEGVTDLSVHVTDPVEHGEDFVVGLAAHPAIAAIERGTVDRLLESIAHEA